MRQARLAGGEDTALMAVMTLQAASDSLGEKLGKGKGENAGQSHLAQQLLSEDVSVWWVSGHRGGQRPRFWLSGLFLVPDFVYDCHCLCMGKMLFKMPVSSGGFATLGSIFSFVTWRWPSSTRCTEMY